MKSLAPGESFAVALPTMRAPSVHRDLETADRIWLGGGASVWLDRCGCGKWKTEGAPRCASCTASLRHATRRASIP